ncbi:hypothetical protein C8R46DRAFT_888145 [Mycena filopes]|nr:hypothetical protein C8R46DRAFT_888145 [Mycena filopes]
MHCLFNALLGRLKEAPHNREGWNRAVRIAESCGDIVLLRKTYDALLKQYPDTASAQIAYLNHFALGSTVTGLIHIHRFLLSSPSCELWDFYLGYVRRMNPPSLLSSRANVREAYEFAAKNIGHDHKSGPMWAQYLQVLDTGDVGGVWEASTRTELLRSTYHRCLRIPLENVESLWVQYEAFETNVDASAASRLLDDLWPAHMQACIVLRQLVEHLAGLDITSGQLDICLPAPATFSGQELELIGRWKEYLKWEEGNPLAIQEKDNDLLLLRIRMAYRKAVIRMRYYPEFWFRAFSWSASVGRTEEALAILKAGMQANPDSFALTYAYAELLEKTQLETGTRNFCEIHLVYERFVGVLRDQLVLARRQNGQEELPELEKQYTNAWINYLRFIRRAEGHRAFHDAFESVKAGNDEYIGWELYEWAAVTQYRCDPQDGRAIAVRTFETGLARYGSNATYILSYLGFLLTVNDANDARALFKRVIGTFTPQQAKPIWEHWSRSQYEFGDLEACLDLERRMAKVYPNGALDPESARAFQCVAHVRVSPLL